MLLPYLYIAIYIFVDFTCSGSNREDVRKLEHITLMTIRKKKDVIVWISINLNINVNINLKEEMSKKCPYKARLKYILTESLSVKPFPSFFLLTREPSLGITVT